MKSLVVVTLLLMITVSGCSTKLSFTTLSEKIYRNNGGTNDKSTFKLNYYQKDARSKALLLDSSAFLKGRLKDTLFILEGYNIETGALYERIWNKNNQISYSYLRGVVALQKQSVFTNNEVKLVTNWDTTQIRREEKKNSNWLDNNLLINAARCYKSNHSWKIDRWLDIP